MRLKKPVSIAIMLITMLIAISYIAQRSVGALSFTETHNTSDPLAPVAVSENGKYLVDAQGNPFFWIADTAWGLNQRLTREEIIEYLDERHQQGFTVVHIKIPHRERDIPNPPNRYGLRPFINKDISQPNDEYFELVDFSLSEMEKRGMVAAVVPLWGYVIGGKYKYNVSDQDVKIYARWISERYKDRKNIVWITGGDSGSDSRWVTLGTELKPADPQKLVAFHPGRKRISSFHLYGDAPWIDFHMTQTGHSLNLPDNYLTVNHVYNESTKPMINTEPIYEDKAIQKEDQPTIFAPPLQIRKSAYWSLLAGAFGHVYGHADILREKVNWLDSLDSPGALQMSHLISLLRTVPWHTFRPMQSLIASANPTNGSHVRASASADNRIAFIYFPEHRSATIDLSQLEGPLRGRWFNPQTGNEQILDIAADTQTLRVTPPYQPDALLILEPLHGLATETPTATAESTITPTATATPTATPTITPTPTATAKPRGLKLYMPVVYVQ